MSEDAGRPWLFSRHWHFWRDEIERRPAVLGWIAIWSANAYMNYATGVVVGGNVLGICFLSIAFLASIASAEHEHAAGWPRRMLSWTIIAQLVLGQYCGWQTLGLNLATGAGELAAQATTRSALDQRIARYRAERAEIGTVRPIATIEKFMKLEKRNTSRKHPDGEGDKYTDLARELGKAKRAYYLDEELPKLIARLGEAPAISDANALYVVPLRLANSAVAWVVAKVSGAPVAAYTSEDVRFVFMLFMVALLEVLATLGRKIFSIGVRPVALRAAGGGGPGPRSGASRPEGGLPPQYPAGPPQGMQPGGWRDAAFDPALLPAPAPMLRGLPPPPANDRAWASGWPGVPVGPQGQPHAPGGGAMIINNVGGAPAQQQHLPARIAARRAVGTYPG